MTKRELELLEIAKEILELNKNKFLELRLTGSLMLALRGIKKPREAQDIDFLITEDCVAKKDEDYCPIMPVGFFMDYNGKASSPDCIYFTKDKLKVDFIPSWEKAEYVNNIQCASVDACLDAKYTYTLEDVKDVADKHFKDIEYIEDHNKL